MISAFVQRTVHYRVGSLEMFNMTPKKEADVHYRVGSLETWIRVEEDLFAFENDLADRLSAVIDRLNLRYGKGTICRSTIKRQGEDGKISASIEVRPIAGAG